MGVIKYFKESLSNCRDYIMGGFIKSFIEIESKLKKYSVKKGAGCALEGEEFIWHD